MRRTLKYGPLIGSRKSMEEITTIDYEQIF
jgi:hypothetical protein